jgi:hypothetical protein
MAAPRLNPYRWQQSCAVCGRQVSHRSRSGPRQQPGSWRPRQNGGSDDHGSGVGRCGQRGRFEEWHADPPDGSAPVEGRGRGHEGPRQRAAGEGRVAPGAAPTAGPRPFCSRPLPPRDGGKVSQHDGSSQQGRVEQDVRPACTVAPGVARFRRRSRIPFRRGCPASAAAGRTARASAAPGHFPARPPAPVPKGAAGEPNCDEIVNLQKNSLHSLPPRGTLLPPGPSRMAGKLPVSIGSAYPRELIARQVAWRS